jgi:hypothetical protein
MRSTYDGELSPEQASGLIGRLTDAQQRRERQRTFFRLFPDEDTAGPDGRVIHARHRYPKHLEFFEARRGLPRALFHGGEPRREDLRRGRI